ncbi:sensor protein KdpD [compost metagenome]
MPDAIRDSLFDSMVSLRNERSGSVPHLGLGLYIARLISEFHGGRLRAENIPSGAAFQAELPRAV